MRKDSSLLGSLYKCLSSLLSIAFAFKARQAYLTGMSVSGTRISGPFIQQQTRGLLHVRDHVPNVSDPDAHRWAEPHRDHGARAAGGEGCSV